MSKPYKYIINNLNCALIFYKAINHTRSSTNFLYIYYILLFYYFLNICKLLITYLTEVFFIHKYNYFIIDVFLFNLLIIIKITFNFLNASNY